MGTYSVTELSYYSELGENGGCWVIFWKFSSFVIKNYLILALPQCDLTHDAGAPLGGEHNPARAASAHLARSSRCDSCIMYSVMTVLLVWSVLCDIMMCGIGGGLCICCGQVFDRLQINKWQWLVQHLLTPANIHQTRATWYMTLHTIWSANYFF